MSDPRPQNRFRLAPKESPSPVFPVAGPISTLSFLSPSEGQFSLEALHDEALAFDQPLALEPLTQVNLRTSGYDDPEWIEMVSGAQESLTPPPSLQPMAVTTQAIAPEQAKPLAGFGAVIASQLPLSPPRMVASTLRTKFSLGPNPNKPKPAPAPLPPPPEAVAKPVAQAPVIPKPSAAPAVQGKPVPSAPVPPKIIKPAPPTITTPAAAPSITVKPAQAPPPPPPPVQRPAAAAASAAPAMAKSAPEPPAVTVKAPEPKVVQERPIEKPVEKPAEKPKISVRPAPPQPPAPASRPMAARDRGGNALPVERPEVEAPPPPAPKPKVQPIRVSEPAAAASSSFVTDGPHLGMPEADGFWAKASGATKGGIIVAGLLVLLGGGYFATRDGGNGTARTGTASKGAPPSTISDQTSNALILTGGGWSTNWGSQESVNKGKQISIYRPTTNTSDYRIEFRGQIEQKAIGWIFRAKDPRNYHVMKLDMIKRGLNPVIALIKYSVIDGKEDTHTQVMLDGNYTIDTLYAVRTDVKGNKFTTYINDKLADYWTDDQIKTGGAGFYSEKGERAQIKSSTFSYLPAGSK